MSPAPGLCYGMSARVCSRLSPAINDLSNMSMYMYVVIPLIVDEVRYYARIYLCTPLRGELCCRGSNRKLFIVVVVVVVVAISRCFEGDRHGKEGRREDRRKQRAMFLRKGDTIGVSIYI